MQWHESMGHPSFKQIFDLLQLKLVDGADGVTNGLAYQDFHCETCDAAKQHREPFTLSNTKFNQRPDCF